LGVPEEEPPEELEEEPPEELEEELPLELLPPCLGGGMNTSAGSSSAGSLEGTGSSASHAVSSVLTQVRARIDEASRARRTDIVRQCTMHWPTRQEEFPLVLEARFSWVLD
jgi:hypothetical protein